MSEESAKHLQEKCKKIPPEAIAWVRLYQLKPAAGQVPKFNLDRDREIFEQCFDYLESKGIRGNGTWKVMIDGPKDKRWADGVLEFRLPDPEKAPSPAPAEPSREPNPASAAAAVPPDAIAELIRRKKEIDAAQDALLGPEEPDEEEDEDDDEEEEPPPKPQLSDLFVESMMTDDGKAMVVETIGGVVEEVKGLLGALRHRLKHGVTPVAAAATPSVGQPARPQSSAPVRSVPLQAVPNPKPAAAAAPAEPKKESA